MASVAFTPLCGVHSTDPCCYLLEVDKARILRDVGWNAAFAPALLAPLRQASGDRVDLVLVARRLQLRSLVHHEPLNKLLLLLLLTQGFRGSVGRGIAGPVSLRGLLFVAVEMFLCLTPQPLERLVTQLPPPLPQLLFHHVIALLEVRLQGAADPLLLLLRPPRGRRRRTKAPQWSR